MASPRPAAAGARLRALCTGLSVVALLALAPATAIAGEVTGTSGNYDYTDAGGSEVNNLTITRSGASLVFTDTAGATDASTECTQTNATTVTCTSPFGSYFDTDVTLAGGNDRADGGSLTFDLEMSGDAGNDTLIGGGEDDILTGGADNDTLIGNGGDDTLSGDGGTDDLQGGNDDDNLQGGAGPDTLSGGAHRTDTFDACGDEVQYPEKTNNLNISLDGAANDDTGDGDTIGGDIESVYGGTGGDTLTGNDAPNCLDGQDGNDNLSGRGGDDTLRAGLGADTLNGETGDDRLRGESGVVEPDGFAGGDGVDSVSLTSGVCDASTMTCTRSDSTVTLDGQANDGRAGEGDNVGADIEDVTIFTSSSGDAASAANVTGNAEFNILTTGEGPDTIDPAGGSDLVTANGRDDTVNARDGFSDRINCGPGNDTANVDQLDVVQNCETVNREQRPVALEDLPPTVTFTAPAAGARIAANTPTLLTATAADDRGIARVLFMDDDRVVCTDTAPPYDCNYQPRAEDVNRNTLAVVAVDTAEQIAFAGRTVTVPRFTATRLTARTTPKRDRRRPFRFTTTGRLVLPALVAPASGCKGRITIQVKTGGNTISTRRTNVTRRCTYRSRVTFRVPRRLVRRALKVTVRFGGNAVVLSKTAKSYFIRTS